MSLLDDYFESFEMLDRTTTGDGYGGIITTWISGAKFQAAATFDRSTEARIAAVQGAVDRYKITTRKAVNLQYHDVVRRLSDKKIFRVTTDGDDVKTPPSASLDMRQVDAEEWELNGIEEEVEDGQGTGAP